jgi:hypothetical protein
MPTEEVSHYIFTVIWFLFLILFFFLDKKETKNTHVFILPRDFVNLRFQACIEFLRKTTSSVSTQPKSLVLRPPSARQVLVYRGCFRSFLRCFPEKLYKGEGDSRLYRFHLRFCARSLRLFGCKILFFKLQEILYSILTHVHY